MVSCRKILVCQNKACRKSGSAKVLDAFEANLPADIDVIGSRCLGQCGNGPIVLVLPEEVWYCRVHPDEVPNVVEQHLHQNKPIRAMLYRKFHP